MSDPWNEEHKCCADLFDLLNLWLTGVGAVCVRSSTYRFRRSKLQPVVETSGALNVYLKEVQHRVEIFVVCSVLRYCEVCHLLVDGISIHSSSVKATGEAGTEGDTRNQEHAE